MQTAQTHLVVQNPAVADQVEIEEQLDQVRRNGTVNRELHFENRRPQVLVKPAKMNIPEFHGSGTDSWIQTIEMYFEAARTPPELKTEMIDTYLKGAAMEWWRGTGIIANTLPWYRFCRHLGDRFAETSVYDNVRAFHVLTQTNNLNEYILKYEQNMNLMRGEDPALPDDYFKNSFISGLNDSIQHHVQCHEPPNL